MATDIQTAQENRLSIFANVFKSYMSIMPVVTAALAPLLTALNVLPTYESQRKPLATMAGVLGFLLLAWIFYVRRTIALGSIKRGFRWLFNLLPLVLIFGSVGCYVAYANVLEASIGVIFEVKSCDYAGAGSREFESKHSDSRLSGVAAVLSGNVPLRGGSLRHDGAARLLQ